MRELLVLSYRDFIVWGSLYDVTDSEEQERRREQVSLALSGLSGGYLPRSMWLEPATRKKIEAFTRRAGTLLEEFSEDVRARGYARARTDFVRRVTRDLGPLRKEVEAGLDAELAGNVERRWWDGSRR